MLPPGTNATIEKHPEKMSYTVWYLDGNLKYYHSPQTYLFIAAILTFVFLWLPYTFLLLFIATAFEEIISSGATPVDSQVHPHLRRLSVPFKE